MPLEGVSSSFGITCWYRAPVTVLYGVARCKSSRRAARSVAARGPLRTRRQQIDERCISGASLRCIRGEEDKNPPCLSPCYFSPDRRLQGRCVRIAVAALTRRLFAMQPSRVSNASVAAR